MPTSATKLFLGEKASGDVLEADVLDVGDNGVGFLKRARTRTFMPDEMHGECIFARIYVVVVSKFGGEGIVVTPIVDGEELESATKVVPSSVKRTRHIFEFNVTEPYLVDAVEQGRFYARGQGIQVQLDWDALTELVIEGVSVEWEPVQESMTAGTGPP